MTEGLSKLAAWLIAIFAICVAILAADLAYVFWRRRRFHRRSSSAEDSSAAGGDSSVYVLSSKELLYFFCWTNQSRIEPNDHQVNAVDHSSEERAENAPLESCAGEEDEEIDDLKFQEMYGRSRLLFTIKEEEESHSVVSGDPKSLSSDGQGLVEDFQEIGDVEVPAVVLTVEHDNEEEATPFSTPCASPSFYTPSPSPSRDEVSRSYESYGEEHFVSLDITTGV